MLHDNLLLNSNLKLEKYRVITWQIIWPSRVHTDRTPSVYNENTTGVQDSLNLIIQQETYDKLKCKIYSCFPHILQRFLSYISNVQLCTDERAKHLTLWENLNAVGVHPNETTPRLVRGKTLQRHSTVELLEKNYKYYQCTVKRLLNITTSNYLSASSKLSGWKASSYLWINNSAVLHSRANTIFIFFIRRKASLTGSGSYTPSCNNLVRLILTASCGSLAQYQLLWTCEQIERSGSLGNFVYFCKHNQSTINRMLSKNLMQFCCGRRLNIHD